MVVPGYASPVKQTCQPCDKPQKPKKEPTTSIPQEWKLTSQQQDFIETLMEDDAKKQ